MKYVKKEKKRWRVLDEYLNKDEAEDNEKDAIFDGKRGGDVWFSFKT